MPGEKKYIIELDSEEVDLLSMAASARADQFTRSLQTLERADHQLRSAWIHAAHVLRNVATRLATLKNS